jgi:peptide-methionine (S)-S-oxide reductase
MKNSEIIDPIFRKAVEAIDNGDLLVLQELLKENPDLTTKPLDTPNGKGYFKNPYLLWFVADNPIRHENLPANIVEITKTILKALKQNRVDNYQYIVNYTLGLVCTGRITKECGVQIPLMETLINEGAAKVKGSVLGAIAGHNIEAAKYLIDKGADYNLATAVGLGKIDNIKKLAKNATASELYVALVVASFLGKSDIISLLIEAGANVNGDSKPEDFDGFHSHATPLHQAVSSGSLDAVKLLAENGANLNATDKIYNGTPLGWAKYMQTEEDDKIMTEKYKEIENYLAAK